MSIINSTLTWWKFNFLKISIEISKGLKLESRQNLVCLQNQTKLTTWKSGIDIVLNYSKEPITDHFLSTFWGVSDNIVIHKYHINKWKFFNPKTFPSQDKNIKYLSDKIQIIYPFEAWRKNLPNSVSSKNFFFLRVGTVPHR